MKIIKRLSYRYYVMEVREENQKKGLNEEKKSKKRKNWNNSREAKFQVFHFSSGLLKFFHIFLW